MEGGINRRDLLRGALAAAGVLALPNQAHATNRVLNTFRSELGVLSAEMRSPRIRANLASGTPAMIRRILAENTIRLPSLSTLKDSPLNPERLLRYPLLLGSRVETRGGRRRHLSLIGAGDAGRQVYNLAEAANSRIAHGNATAIASQTVITAGHLESALVGVPEVTMLSAAQTDIAVALVAGQHFSAEQMVRLPAGIRDTDVHGQLVVIPGIDPDASAMHRGMYKMYDGLAFQMTPAMARVLFAHDENDPESVRMWHWAHHSLCLVIPEGESLPHRQGEAAHRAAGMSGSPVFMLRDGEYVFVGVFWGVSGFSYQDKQFSLGFFLGPDTLNRAGPLIQPPQVSRR